MRSEPGATRRLHPSSLLFGVGSAAWKLLIPGLLILLLSRGKDPEIWLMALFVPAVVAAVARYLTFGYRLDDDELVVRRGVLTRSERKIPYARIQNIDLLQNPLHRLLGVADVKLETAGGEEPEAKLQVLSLRAVELLRERVYRERGQAQAETPATTGPRTVLALSTADLMLLGLMSNRGLILVLGLWGLIWQLGSRDWAPAWSRRLADPGAIDGEKLKQLLGRPVVGELPTWLWVAAALTALLAVVVVLRLISIVWALIRFWGFRLTRSGDDLGTEHGLLNRRTAILPRHRIQLLTLRQTPMHRWFGRAEVKVQTAGGGWEKQLETGREAIAPLVGTEELGRVLAEIDPGLDLGSLDWHPVEARAWRRVRTRTLLTWALLTAIAFLLGGGRLAAAAASLAIPALGVARMGFRRLAYVLTDRFVAARRGWWVRRISVVRLAKVQVVETGQNPFDRRHGMATLRVDTAGGRLRGQRLRIPYLAVGLAAELQSRLSLEAARTEFRW